MQGQEGTLWWHAHSSWLRATVYGALIIRPREGDSYPFTKPNRETTLLMGNHNNNKITLHYTINNHTLKIQTLLQVLIIIIIFLVIIRRMVGCESY